MQSISAKFLIALPTLAEGEHYAGIVLDEVGHPTHHLILLPQQPETSLSWNDAMKWANGIGAEMPTRQELALLNANIRHEFIRHPFKAKWYWSSSEQSVGNESDAWIWVQDFNEGMQYLLCKDGQSYICAIRRLLID